MTCGVADRYGPLAQLGARRIGSAKVVGSSPIWSIIIGSKHADIIIEGGF